MTDGSAYDTSMTPEQWHRVKEVFEAALGRAPEERSAFLGEACGGDDLLRSEVKSLLSSYEQETSFMETPAAALAAQSLVKEESAALVGQQLGHYEIVRELGHGGMGVVYLAQDLSLGRPVALKALPPRLTGDPDRLRRFEREARAASALNHPNILTIYEIAQVDGLHFIATEFIDGVTLRERIRSNEMKLSDALDIAVQTTSALSAAHEAGIVHRDIKPENVMLRRDGYVKVLDFGLAKLIERQVVNVNTESAAMPGISTAAGVLMGTIGFMSPEQARGVAVDARTDIFSLGVVIYEMVTGRAPFEGATTGDVIAAVLTTEPLPLSQYTNEAPPELERIVNKALRKQIEQRYQTVSDMALDLKSLRRELENPRLAPPLNEPGDASNQLIIGGDSSAAPAVKETVDLTARQVHLWARSRRLLLWASIVLILAALLAITLKSPLPTPKILRYAQITNDGQQKTRLVTDGSRLYIQESVNNKSTLVQVSATGGETVPFPVSFPNPGLDDISPSGSELFVGSYDGPYPFTYWLVPLPGGSPRPLGDVRAADVHPSPDGQQIAYCVGSDLYLAKSDGTESRKIATVPDGLPGDVCWAPDGKRLRFTVWHQKAEEYSIWEVAADGSNLHPLLSGWNNPAAECCGRWTPDGSHFIFEAKRDGVTNLWAIREEGSFWRKPIREPVQLTTGPIHFRAPVPSKDGKKIFAIGDQVRGEIMRYDTRSEEWIPYSPGSQGKSIGSLSFSRDAEWVAYTTYPDDTLWRSKVDGTDLRQLTFPPMEVLEPRWSPDGQQIAFTGRTPGKLSKIYSVSAAGGNPEQLIPVDESEAFADWSPDGNRLVFGGSPFFAPGTKAPTALHIIDLSTKQVSVMPGSEGCMAPRWSPDGRYILAHRFDFQKLMLFDLTTGKWIDLAKGILHFANWSRDSKYIFFESWGTDTAACRIGISDRKVEKIGSLKEFRRTIGAERCWSGLTPDNSLLVLRDIGSQEIYALDLVAP